MRSKISDRLTQKVTLRGFVWRGEQQNKAWCCYNCQRDEFYVSGFVHRESMSIIVQQDATIYSFILFLQIALRFSDDTLIHHQEHTQTVITTSGTGQTVFATVHWHGGVGIVGRIDVTTPPHQRTVANTVQPVPDVVIAVWVCSWCRAVCRNIIKLHIVTSCWTVTDSQCMDPWT